MREHLVVGAGISGLYAALLLARRGHRVRIIEKSTRVGGLASAEHFRGLPCDLGSHRLHPSALEEPLFRELHVHAPFLVRPRHGVLLFADRHLPYPPRALSMVRALGLRATLPLATSLLARTGHRRAFAGWEKARAPSDDAADVGFERFVIERVGEPAYRAFYQPYAQKVWGILPAELSQSVAKKRVSTTRPWALVESFAGAIASFLDRAPDARREHIDTFVYPARGIASIIDELSSMLASAGVSIERERAYLPNDAHDKTVLFAGDLADLVPTSLEHRGLYLVYLALPIERVGLAETYYCPDARYWFGRVAEIQNYSPELRRGGETILTVEIPEGAFGQDVDFTRPDRLDELMNQLARAGVLPRGVPVLEVRQRFIPKVYPLYRRGWITEWTRTMERVAALGNVIPVGRQALFLHCNLDHCAAIARDAVDHIEANRSTSAWIADASRYLELRVRD